MPFICIATTCPKPHELYKTIELWVSHLNKEHAQDLWKCTHSNHPSSMDFFSEDGIVAHVLDDHGDEVTEEVAREIARTYRISFVDSLKNCPFCGDTEFDNKQKILEHIADHLVWLSQISLSAHEIPKDFEMDYASEAGKGPRTSSTRSGNNFMTEPSSKDEHIPIASRTEELSHYVNEAAPDLSPENMHTWQELTAHPTTKTNYDPAHDKVLLKLISFQPPDMEDARAVTALGVSSQMAPDVDMIRSKVTRALYKSKAISTFRAFANRLVEEETLSDYQLDQHHTEISRIYNDWRTESQVQHDQRDQHQPPSTKSVRSRATTPKATTSSPLENARTATTMEILKEAVASIIPDVRHSTHLPLTISS